MADFNEVTFEDLLSTLYEGRSGTSIESTLKSFDQSGVDGPYTVYWPKSSIRVIRGADYGTARAIACILRDDRARWMNEPTTYVAPVIARARAELGTQERATPDQARSSTIYVHDKLLRGDIRVHRESLEMLQYEGEQLPARFDYSTLPEH